MGNDEDAPKVQARPMRVGNWGIGRRSLGVGLEGSGGAARMKVEV